MDWDFNTLFWTIDWKGMALPALSVAEKILRTGLVFGFLVIALRLAGKREIAQLNPFDFIVLLVLSNTLQNSVIGNDNSVTGGFIGAAALLLINWGVNRALLNHPRRERWLTGSKTMLVSGGAVDHKALKKELITAHELEMAAHKQGIASLDEVESAEIDPDGELFFVAKTPPPEEIRHREILERLDALTRELDDLRRRLP